MSRTSSGAADVLGVPEHTLAQWRSKGTGPEYVKVGRHVRYRWTVVNEWLDAQTSARSDLICPVA